MIAPGPRGRCGASREGTRMYHRVAATEVARPPQAWRWKRFGVTIRDWLRARRSEHGRDVAMAVRRPGQAVSPAHGLQLLSGHDGRTLSRTGLITTAQVVEMFHNVSLIIDDIVDGSPERRGKATLHAQIRHACVHTWCRVTSWPMVTTSSRARPWTSTSTCAGVLGVVSDRAVAIARMAPDGLGAGAARSAEGLQDRSDRAGSGDYARGHRGNGARAL